MTDLTKKHISGVALLVRDYDEAIKFYSAKLGFSVLEDVELDEGLRWVRIAPTQSSQLALILNKAESAEQHAALGNQAGGLVFFILQTDDFWRDYEFMRAQGVTFCEEPRVEPYGIVVVFEDLYGNKIDLIQPAS